MKEQRRTKRFKVGKTSVVTIAGVSHVVQIGDVSYGGVGVISDTRPELGATVTLDGERDDAVRGKVIRHTENGFALELALDRGTANYALKNIISKLVGRSSSNPS